MDPDPEIQMQKIIAAFNAGNRGSILTNSRLLGKRIGRNQFRIVHRNNVHVEMIGYTEIPKRLEFSVNGITQEVGVFDQTQYHFGAHGRYVVNVPQGKLSKCWEGSQPVFLGEGPHVIRHPNFRLEFTDSLVDLATDYIEHGTYHILRIPRGKIAKIWIGPKPYLLDSKIKPYIFNDPLFHLEPKINPATRQRIENFEDAHQKLIVHGSIKRLLPRTGEIAIAYDNGQLIVVGASKKPVLYDSPTFFVDSFLTTSTQTLVFPSDKTQEERVKQRLPPDHVSYEVFYTSDGLPIGVKLLVVYEISDPQVALHKLKKEDIVPHIENLVVADMGSVIQSCSSSDFQKTNQTRTREPIKNSSDMSVAAEFFTYLQDEVKNHLHRDFLEYGITLIRINIETPKILDAKISAKMAEYSLINSEARAKVSVLDSNNRIAQQQVMQEAEKKKILQEQDNTNRLSQVRAESAATKIRAQAELDAAELRAKATKVEAEARVSALESQAKLFEIYPELLEMEMTKLKMDALKGVQLIISPEIATFAAMQGLFKMPMNTNVQTNVVKNNGAR
eukprot:TRINITY_DN6164_c0_g1_i1.p1 TRINITY_DN6164_c0_g1~~TRINITY_DN6164_c0_g1_i1.p1  ORF type:complete len:574 (+),score=133.17 TRINITY_DN6164_c0_g1_i1:43-1722(+)